MCDTLVAVGKATMDGIVIFGKNSDRSPNESQPLVKHPLLSHEEPTVKCQNIDIPQVPITYEQIGSRPYWLWGYEHGVNEFGVVIGNLGVHSKEPYETPAD
jgi:secernin